MSLSFNYLQIGEILWHRIISIIVLYYYYLYLLTYLTVKEISNFDSKRKTKDGDNNNKVIDSILKVGKEVEVLKDYRVLYYMCLLCLAMPSICNYWYSFVYQSFIIESKNWGKFAIAQSFMILLNTFCCYINFFGLFN